MPVHDWTRVDAGTFHSFHNAWITHLMGQLNGGVLPRGYYALSEQYSSGLIPDVLTLHLPDSSPGATPHGGGIALADAPPRVSRKLTADPKAIYRARRRTLTIRHTSGHQIVAFLEIVSPGNKDRTASIQELVNKIDAALTQGIHVMTVDLFPPGRFDPQGLHGAVWARYGMEEYVVPADQPLTACSYRAVAPVHAYIEHMGFGAPLPEMPLFLDAETYIYVPLELTYQAAFQDMPVFLRERARGAASGAVTVPTGSGLRRKRLRGHPMRSGPGREGSEARPGASVTSGFQTGTGSESSRCLSPF